MLNRQKSPQQQKNGLLVGSTVNQNSNFGYSFMNTDSSPRQTSGRQAQGSGSAGTKLTSNFQSQSSSNQIESTSTSNLDLMVSGQKVGARKDSPTNTPRQEDINNLANNRLIQDQKGSATSANKPFTRRLKPLENMHTNTNNNDILNSSGENQFIRNKT